MRPSQQHRREAHRTTDQSNLAERSKTGDTFRCNVPTLLQPKPGLERSAKFQGFL